MIPLLDSFQTNGGERQQSLLNLIQNLPGIVYRCCNDAEWTMEFVSEQCLELTGYPASDLMGNRRLSFASLIHPEDRSQVWGQVQAALALRQRYHLTYRIRTGQGPEKWVNEQGRGLYDAQDQLVALEGFITDITEHKRTEQTLKNSEQRARILFESAPDANYLIDLNGRFIDGNRAAERLVGYAREELLGKSFLQLNLLDESDLARAANLLARNLQGHPTGPTELTLRRGDQTRVTIEVSSFPLQVQDQVMVLGIARDITESKQAEEDLRLSEERFRSVWEHSIDGMRLTNRDGRIIAVNDAYCQLVRLPRAKLLGQVFSIIYAGHKPDEGIELYTRRFDEGSIVPRLSARVRLWNGEELDLEISNSFLELGRQGKLVLSLFRDVSQRRRAELRSAAFTSLAHRLSAVKHAREAASVIVDVAEQLLGWDACCFALYSMADKTVRYVLNMDTIDGQRVETSLPGPDLPAATPPSALGSRAVHEPLLILKSDPALAQPGAMPFGNSSRPSASILYVAVRNDAEVLGLLTIQSYRAGAYNQEDLQTLQALADHCGGALARINAHEALQVAQQRLSHLLTQSPAVLYSFKIQDTLLQPVWISQSFELLSGFTPEEGCHPDWWWAHVHPEDRPALLQGLAHIKAQKQIARDYRIRHRQGHYRWVHDEQRLVCDSAGKPVEVVGSWIDHTERKALEEQLRQAQKMEAIGQLAGGVAHDFNNLLAVIRGNADLALMHDPHLIHGVAENLKQITTATERASNLTRQLLAFGRKQVLHPQPLDLNSLIANLGKMLRRVIGEDIRLQCDYDPQPQFVHADAGMLEQVILNLVVNARDAMPKGGQLTLNSAPISLPAAAASLAPEAQAGDFVCLQVADTGQGIAPEHLARIFEPFFTTKAPGKGTGLGLAMVYGIIKQHRGWIEVDSRPGAGSTFKIFLPAIAIPNQAVDPSPVVTALPVPGGTERILLVEDDPAVRQLTQRLLESKGYRVWKAASGREALSIWQAHAEAIDLLLTDIVLPDGLTGRELGRQLQSQRPELRLIYMSGYSPEAVGKDLDLQRNSDGHFLQKPYSSRALMMAVRAALEQPRTLNDPNRHPAPSA